MSRSPVFVFQTTTSSPFNHTPFIHTCQAFSYARQGGRARAVLMSNQILIVDHGPLGGGRSSPPILTPKTPEKKRGDVPFPPSQKSVFCAIGLRANCALCRLRAATPQNLSFAKGGGSGSAPRGLRGACGPGFIAEQGREALSRPPGLFFCAHTRLCRLLTGSAVQSFLPPLELACASRNAHFMPMGVPR